MALTYRRQSSAASPPVDAQLPAPRDGAAPEQLVAALALAEEFGDSRLLVSDLRVAFLLINNVRLRGIARLFGVGPEQANLLTFVVALWLAQGAHLQVKRLAKPPPLPSSGDGLLVGGSVQELVGWVVGPPVRDTPTLGLLLMLAVVGGTAGPTAVKSLRAVRAGSHRASLAFHHRYGFLVDPGHWRARRARSWETAHSHDGPPAGS